MMWSSFSFAYWPFVNPFLVLSFVEYLKMPFKDLWCSLSFATLSLLVLFPMDSLAPLILQFSQLCLLYLGRVPGFAWFLFLHHILEFLSRQLAGAVVRQTSFIFYMSEYTVLCCLNSSFLHSFVSCIFPSVLVVSMRGYI